MKKFDIPAWEQVKLLRGDVIVTSGDNDSPTKPIDKGESDPV